MLHLRRDGDDIAGMQFARLLSPCLVSSAARDADQDLPALMVYVPVVAASRLEGHVGDANGGLGEHLQIALAFEMGSVRVGLPGIERAEVFGDFFR